MDSISKSALAVTKVLLGHAPDELPPMVASDTATETIWQTAMEQSKYWKSVDPKACEPREGAQSFILRPALIENCHRVRRDDILDTR